MSLTKEQIETLLRPIRPQRVLQAQGQSHVPAYDVTAHLSRIFGFGGWSKNILDLKLVYEWATQTSQGKDAWEVCYSCTMRLSIKDPVGNYVAHYDDGACGTSKQPSRGEAHDMALKSAISYALKRSAKDLGDQFGLSLYNKGNLGPLLGKTLVNPAAAVLGNGPQIAPDLEAHIPKPESMGNDEIQEAS